MCMCSIVHFKMTHPSFLIAKVFEVVRSEMIDQLRSLQTKYKLHVRAVIVLGFLSLLIYI